MTDVPTRARPAGPVLVDRAVESRALRSFLGRALDGGATLLLTGEAGVGKSALLDATVRTAQAAGATVVRAAGVEFEAEVGFAGLNQILLPLLDHVPSLPRAHQDALGVAMGLGAGPPPDHLLLSSAVLGLLARAATSRPVLVVVDDVPWLDRSSVRVLGFVARRLAGTSVGLLAAARTGSDSELLHAGLPVLDVSPLDERASEALLDDRFPALAPEIRRRVLSLSGGNALALLELPAVMTEAQRAGRAPLPSELPLGAQLQGVFAGRLGRLPAATRRLLLLAALDGTGELGTLRAAAGDERWLDDLAPAELAGLVRIDLAEGRVTLRHPLISSAVVGLASSGDRRRAHGDLAFALVDRPEAGAWHLARAVMGVDDRAADLLERVAHRAKERGDATGAVQSLVQAAQLTPTGPDRARRWATAAFLGADTRGGLRDVPDLLAQARAGGEGIAEPVEVAVAAAHHLLHGEGDVDTAHLMLTGAVERLVHEPSGALGIENALHTLMLVCHLGGRNALWQPFDRALADLGPAVPPLVAVSGSTFADPARATSATLHRLDELVASANASVDPSYIVRVATAAMHTDRLSLCREALRRVVRAGRTGAAASALQASMILCHDALDGGRWAEAERTAREGIDRGEELGHHLAGLSGVYCVALLAAARGDDDTAATLADDLLAWSTPRGADLVADYAHRVRGLSALGRGQFEDAFQALSRIAPAGAFPPHSPVAVSVALDLVEAAVRTGRRDEAAAHVRAMAGVPLFAGRPRHALAAAGAAALVASGEHATEGFERALAVPRAELHPFELARVRLCYGEHLRRARATHAARAELFAALETFRALGALPWAARAESELQAAGTTHRELVTGRGAVVLTSREHQVAALAASGLSNKQIGSRLYLSPRTVGAHLYRAFPKLGVTSRAALRDALDGSRIVIDTGQADVAAG